MRRYPRYIDFDRLLVLGYARVMRFWRRYEGWIYLGVMGLAVAGIVIQGGRDR